MILIYIPLLILGFLAGIVYFWHMWKSIDSYGAQKSKILMSMVFRLPIPIGAALLGYVVARFEGIIAVLVGFTAFQIIFLVKKGQALKREMEEEITKDNGVEKKD